MPQIRAAHLGLLWQRYLKEFPLLQELPPIDTPEENFGPGQVRSITVQLMGPAPVPRHWFLSRDQTRVIQVQPDRFVLNWRQIHPEEPYPRYETLRQEFERHYDTYRHFLAEQGIGTLTVRQAEVNYVNRVALDQTKPPKSLRDVLRTWSPSYGPEASFLATPGEVRLVEGHLIADDEGPYARLYISAEPTLGSALLINVTMRGRPRGTGLSSSLAFFDGARDRIVRAFTAVTTEQMHTLWRRTK
jgi:uncharacterized protein (TIGR04255 family)